MPAPSSGSTLPTAPTARLTGHNGPVHALTYSSADAQYILTGCADRLIRLYNPAKAPLDPPPTHEQFSSITARSAPSGRQQQQRPVGLVQSYTGHGYEVLDIAVSPDNARFASVGGDKSVLLWDVAAAQVLRRWEGHAGRCNAVAWGGAHGEGGVVISGSFDTTVKFWDIKSNSSKPIMTLSDAKDSIACLAVVDAEVYAGCTDGRVRIYDIRMGKLSTDVIGNAVTSLTPTRRNDAYLVSALDSKLQLMDRTSGKLLQSFKSTSSSSITGPTTSTISSGATAGAGTPQFVNATYRLRSTLAANDALAISGAEDGRVWVWDVLSGGVVHVLWHDAAVAAAGSSKRSVVSCVTECPVRDEWCSAGGDGVVVVWASRGSD